MVSGVTTALTGKKLIIPVYVEDHHQLLFRIMDAHLRRSSDLPEKITNRKESRFSGNPNIPRDHLADGSG